MHFRKENIFNKSCLENWMFAYRVIKHVLYLLVHKKSLQKNLSSKCMTWTSKQNKWKILRKIVLYISLCNVFWNGIVLSQKWVQNTDHCDFLKLKYFMRKENRKQVKRQLTEWNSTCYIFHSVLKSRMCREKSK